MAQDHPYRDEQLTLEQRRGDLERAETRLAQQEATLAAVLESRADVLRELGDVRLRLEVLRHRSSSKLDRAAIASPCGAAWSDMAGDDKIRHCLRCDQSVHNAEAMTRDELEILERDACVRLFRRADGTVLTRDCPERARRRRRRMGLALLVTGATTAALAAHAMTPTMGRMRIPPPDACPGHRGAGPPSPEAPQRAHARTSPDARDRSRAPASPDGQMSR